MATRDILKDILLPMQNLKLSSPLRPDQDKDDNKENILAGQDIRKPNGEEKSLDTQTDEKTANQSECREINGVDVTPEGFPSATPQPPSPDTDLNFSSSEGNSVVAENTFISESECLVKNDETVSCEVNITFNEPEQDYTLSNCEQKISTHSSYDDCIDVIGKTQENDAETTYDLNNSQVIEDVINVLSCEEKSQSEETPENSGIVSDQSGRCDETFIEHSQDTKLVAEISEKTFSTESDWLHENSKDKLESSVQETSTELKEQKESSEIIKEEVSHPTVTETNCSLEDIDESIISFASGSSNKSFGTTLKPTGIPTVTESDIVQNSSTKISCTSSNLSESNSSSVVCENSSACSEIKDASIRLDVETVEKEEINKEIEETPNIPLKKMEELDEKLQQAEQAKAMLELELNKKEEIIAEAMKKEQLHTQEIQDFVKILEAYEKTIASRFADYKKLKEENATVNKHLSNLELSFSDLHQKYEKAKSVIFGFKSNEEKLRKAFSEYDETFLKQEGRYESLKAHAQTQIDKCNIEITQQKEKYDSEVTKLKAIVKRLEIKNAALETSLEQKTKECIALAALCDEVTGEKF